MKDKPTRNLASIKREATLLNKRVHSNETQNEQLGRMAREEMLADMNLYAERLGFVAIRKDYSRYWIVIVPNSV